MKKRNRENAIAIRLEVLAYIIFFGWFVVGIVLGQDEYGYFSFSAALLYWFIGIVSGLILSGFAEIIYLLQEISNKLNSKPRDQKETLKSMAAPKERPSRRSEPLDSQHPKLNHQA